jgi:hypothetical protein
MADVALNWATAEVKDGKLSVDLDGKTSSAWKQSFETTDADAAPDGLDARMTKAFRGFAEDSEARKQS